MAINFFIRSRPSRSDLGVIKFQEEKLEMEGWMRYNVMAMLSHFKLEKLKHTIKGRHGSQQSILSVMKID